MCACKHTQTQMYSTCECMHACTRIHARTHARTHTHTPINIILCINRGTGVHIMNNYSVNNNPTHAHIILDFMLSSS